MRIVIVDDDMLVAGALKTILEADKDVTVDGTGWGRCAWTVSAAFAGRAFDGYPDAEG